MFLFMYFKNLVATEKMHPDLKQLLESNPAAGPRPRSIDTLPYRNPFLVKKEVPAVETRNRSRGGRETQLLRIRKFNADLIKIATDAILIAEYRKNFAEATRELKKIKKEKRNQKKNPDERKKNNC